MSLLQNLVSFIRVFCKRDLQFWGAWYGIFPCIYIYTYVYTCLYTHIYSDQERSAPGVVQQWRWNQPNVLNFEKYTILYIYIYICVYTCMYIYIYIAIRNGVHLVLFHSNDETNLICWISRNIQFCTYVYICVYTCMYIYTYSDQERSAPGVVQF